MPEPKPIRLTQHAVNVIAERQLERIWVEAAARDPEWTSAEPGDPTVTRHFRHVPERGNRVLRVAIVETATEIRILSAFLDRRARRPK